jgi:hypothetical protein
MDTQVCKEDLEKGGEERVSRTLGHEQAGQAIDPAPLALYKYKIRVN